jgi:hypothetical protein
MVPKRRGAVKQIDVLSAMHAEPPGRQVSLTVLAEDPFAHV